MTHRIIDSPNSSASIPSASTTPPPSRPNALRRARAGLVDAILTVLAALGVVCIAATIAAFAFNISFIMFKTGSMAPTIPSGSLALVREVPASSVKVGDVTTISRGENELPITHRVISTNQLSGETYEIEMKGDANPGPDPTPYRTETVRKVIWSAPELAYYVARFGTPKYVALTTLAMTVLVVWVFWPKREKK